MTALAWLIPVSLGLGLAGLAAFLWSLRAGQFRDIEGDAARILLPDDPDPNLASPPPPAMPERAPEPALHRPDVTSQARLTASR
ncbi:MAG: cbb3-type cytochrome oxidase assembly protein CcoS [Pseudomonadota bacterium]